MTPAGWRRLAAAVAARSVSCGAAPTPEARLVLQAIVAARARDEDVPAQADFAERLGLPRRTLQRRLLELGELGLEEHDRYVREITAELARLGPAVDRLLAVGEQVTSWARVWRVANGGERREVLGELLKSVRLDVGARALWVEPWEVYAPLFGERARFWGNYAREELGLVRPQVAGLWTPAELGVRAA